MRPRPVAAHVLAGQVNSDVENGEIKEDAPPVQLYDLETDVTQKHNVYEQHPEIAAEMHALREEFIYTRISSRPPH